MFGYLHVLYKNGNRDLYYSVTRLTNLSYKMEKPCIYFETVNDSWGKGSIIYLEDISCYELNFKEHI